MKKQTTSLHPHARAKLPNQTMDGLTFQDMAPLALKLFLYIVHQWEQYRRAHPEVLPLLELRFSLREVVRAIAPESERMVDGHDYRDLQVSLDELQAKARIERKYLRSLPKAAEGKKPLFRLLFAPLFSLVYYDSESGELRVIFSPFFEHCMEILECEGFTLVPLAQALRLHDMRHLRMFLWACRMHHMISDGTRFIPLDRLRKSLGMDAESYARWNVVSAKLKDYCAAVSEQTTYDLSFEPVKQGREVAGVRLEIRDKKGGSRQPH